MDSLTAMPVASEIGVWQLRRVGPPSTVQNSASLVKLREDGEVTIGRGPAADYFLDSAVTLRLISRVHASIRGDRVPGGHPRFTIFNSGLNGTYINDLKMRCYPDNHQVLLEGDRITFGHPGCASIQPGAYAPQHDSEFQFIFECVPASRGAPVDRYYSHNRTVPINGNPRHSHQQKQGTVLTTGNPGSLLTDSPQSNASTSEKENEVGSSLFKDVKNMSLCNGDYNRSVSKHHLGAQESFQPDSNQSRLAKFGHKKSHVLCSEKKLNGNAVDGNSHVPTFAAQREHSNGKLSFPVSSANLSCSSPNMISRTVGSQRDVRNVALSSSSVADKLTSVSPVYPSKPSPPSLSTSHNKPCNSLSREIEVHSTMIILGDEVEDDSSDESSVCDNDLVGDSEIEFVTATGPILPVRINVKIENEESDVVNVENEEIDVVNADNEEIDVVILDNPDTEAVKYDNENDDVETTENGNVENGNSCTIKEDNKGSVVVSDENDVINDNDFNMPSLVLMKENIAIENSEQQDSPESMPSLMPINDLPHVKTYTSNDTTNPVMNSDVLGRKVQLSQPSSKPLQNVINAILKANTNNTSTFNSLPGSRENMHKDTVNNETENKSQGGTTSPLSEKIVSKDTTYNSSAAVTSHSLPKSYIKSPHLKQDNPAESILLHDKFNDVRSTELEVSKRNVVLSYVHSIKSPATYPNSGSIQHVSLNLSKTVRGYLSPVPHSATCSEKPVKFTNISEMTGSKLQPSNLPQSKSFLPTSSQVSALLSPKVTSPRCGSPISNTTTIILSSGNELREVSSRSSRKTSGRSNKHKDHRYSHSSPSSSSSRSSSRSSNHSISSYESPPNSRSSSETSHQKSRQSSEESHQKSRQSSEASHIQSRSSSETSKSSSDVPLSKLKSSSDIKLSKLKPSSELPLSKLKPSSELPLSKLKPSSDEHLSNPRPSTDATSSSKLSSKSLEYSTHNPRPPSESTPKKFFKDTIPNMYSSSDEDDTLQENKTEIVKKIYSSARGKQEKDVGRVEVSRRSALFKGHKISPAADSNPSSSVSQLSSKPCAARRKPVGSGCDSEKELKKEAGDSSPASSLLSSDLSDIEDIEEKIIRTAPEIKSEKKTENKPSELSPAPAKTKSSVNKQLSPSISLTSLPWLTDISVACNSGKKSKLKQTFRKTGLLPRTGPLACSKNDSSLQHVSKEGIKLTQASSAASTVSSPASNGLSFQRTEIKSPKVSIPKSKGPTQSVSSSLRDKAETSLTPGTTLNMVEADASKGKDLTSVSGKKHLANGLKKSHNNDKPLDSKSGSRNIRDKKASSHRVPKAGLVSRKRDSKHGIDYEDQTTDSDEPASKRKDCKPSPTKPPTTPIRQIPKTRQSSSSLHKQNSDSHSDKTDAAGTRQKLVKNGSDLPKPLSTKRKNKQISVLKKDKPLKAKKKRKKIESDTSSDNDDDENQNKQDDGDDDDYDVHDMLEDEDDDDDDSSHSESWELPAGVQYYDNLCSAKKCLNPGGKQVVWVMCDNCEQWYHVVCVDCPIDVVQKEDAQFHCAFC